MIRKGWVPPRSPYSLIQEDLFPSEWLILVAAQMLNLTTRKHLDKVFPAFVKRWDCPQSLLAADRNDILNVISPIGFGNRRTNSIIKMTTQYSETSWVHASELYGIGEYGSRSWEIFCLGYLGPDPPQDGALVKYWNWAKKRGFE